MKNSVEVKTKSKAAKLSPESYLMLYHKIRWGLVDIDLDKLRM